MTLTAADVAEIMRLLDQSSFDELNLEMDGIKLSLRRNTAASSSAFESVATTPMSSELAEQTAPASTAPNVSSRVVDPSLHEVAAPLLGTFYRAPKPGAPPFVEVGSLVEADTVIGIIEVMKLMNTVRAGVRGTVTEIVGSDGELVEYGATILRLRKRG